MGSIIMWKVIDRMPTDILVIAAILLGLAPFSPEPHLVEKIRMLTQGVLTRPLDIFDLCMHAAPAILLVIKLIRSRWFSPTQPEQHDNEER